MYRVSQNALHRFLVVLSAFPDSKFNNASVVYARYQSESVIFAVLIGHEFSVGDPRRPDAIFFEELNVI